MHHETMAPHGFEFVTLTDIPDKQFNKFTPGTSHQNLIPRTHRLKVNETLLLESQDGIKIFAQITLIQKKDQIHDVVTFKILGD
jgi:hypothetical protein